MLHCIPNMRLWISIWIKEINSGIKKHDSHVPQKTPYSCLMLAEHKSQLKGEGVGNEEA